MFFNVFYIRYLVKKEITKWSL